MSHLRVWLRGFVMVCLVATNTTQVARGHYAGAFVVGFLISAVWWSNSSGKREDARGAGLAYGFGAACGTVLGMWIGNHWG